LNTPSQVCFLAFWSFSPPRAFHWFFFFFWVLYCCRDLRFFFPFSALLSEPLFSFSSLFPLQFTSLKCFAFTVFVRQPPSSCFHTFFLLCCRFSVKLFEGCFFFLESPLTFDCLFYLFAFFFTSPHFLRFSCFCPLHVHWSLLLEFCFFPPRPERFSLGFKMVLSFLNPPLSPFFWSPDSPSGPFLPCSMNPGGKGESGSSHCSSIHFFATVAPPFGFNGLFFIPFHFF